MRLTFEWLSTAGNCGSYYLGRIIWVTVGQRLECATDIRVVVYIQQVIVGRIIWVVLSGIQ